MNREETFFAQAAYVIDRLYKVPGFVDRLNLALEGMNQSEAPAIYKKNSVLTDSFVNLLGIHLNDSPCLAALTLVCDPLILATFYDRYCEIEDYLSPTTKKQPENIQGGLSAERVRDTFVDFYREIVGRAPRPKVIHFKPRLP